MKTLETEDLIVFSESDFIYVLDKISHNSFKLSGKIFIENIPDNITIQKLLKEFREKPYEAMCDGITTVYISISKKCNLSCYYCSASLSNNEYISNSQLNYDDFANKILPLLKIINPSKIIITGGEPCLNSDINKIIKFLAVNLDAKIVIQTNGYYLKNIINDVINDINSFNISCNSYFEGIEQRHNLDYLKLYDSKKITLSYVVNKSSRKYLDNFIEYAASLNYRILLNFMTVLGNGMNFKHLTLNDHEMIDVYYHAAKQILSHSESIATAEFLPNYLSYKGECGAKNRKIAIDSDGKIYLCQCMCNDNNYIGDIRLDETSVILHNHHNKTYSNLTQSMFTVDGDQNCCKCPFRYYCGGLCYAVKYYNKNYDYSCYFNQAMIKFLMFYSSKDSMSNLKNFINYKNTIMD